MIKYVLGFIQQTFEAGHNVVESLRNGTVKTYIQPTLSQTGTTTVQAPAPSAGLTSPESKLKTPAKTISQVVPIATEEEKMIFKINYDWYVKKKEQYKNNMIKAYVTIFDYCSKTIQAHISIPLQTWRFGATRHTKPRPEWILRLNVVRKKYIQ